MPRYTIDRFEAGDRVVLEDERTQTFPVPRDWLPIGVREGDVLVTADVESVRERRVIRFEIDAAARQQRLDEATRVRRELPRGPKGDISL